MFCISRPCRDVLPAVILLSRHCAIGLYRVMHIASLTGRLTSCHATITALRHRLVPCFAYRVPDGTPYQLSCYYHGTAPLACIVLRISRPYRDALPIVMLPSRHCAIGLYRVMHIASLSGRPTCCHTTITALRHRLVPCFAYRVPIGTPCRLSHRYHGTATKSCTVLCISRP